MGKNNNTNNLIYADSSWQRCYRRIIVEPTSGASITAEIGKTEIGINECGFIWNLYVPTNRRNGIATMLLNEAEKWLKENGCRYSSLEWSDKDSEHYVLDWYYRKGYDEKQFSKGYALMQKEL